MTTHRQLKELRTTAATVAHEKAAMDEKRDELLAETGKALDLVAAAVRPSLPALVQRLPISGLKRTGPSGEGAVEEAHLPPARRSGRAWRPRGGQPHPGGRPAEGRRRQPPRAGPLTPRGRACRLPLLRGHLVEGGRARPELDRHGQAARPGRGGHGLEARPHLGAPSQGPRRAPPYRWGEAPGGGAGEGPRRRPDPLGPLQPARVSRWRPFGGRRSTQKPARIVRPVTSGPKRAGHRLQTHARLVDPPASETV